MNWGLVRRGLIAGLIAGLVAGAFALGVGEPTIQRAIDIETARAAQVADAGGHSADDHENANHEHIVGRATQRAGLVLASALYGVAIGGLFGLGVAAVCRNGRRRPNWGRATRLAGAVFVAVVLVPFVKYPPNPPGVGDPDTVTSRTLFYGITIAGSLVALVAATRVARRFGVGSPRRATVAGILAFLVLVTLFALSLPAAEEVPPDFHQALLWEFRLRSLATLTIFWAVLAASYGIAVSRLPEAGRTVTAPAGARAR